MIEKYPYFSARYNPETLTVKRIKFKAGRDVHIGKYALTSTGQRGIMADVIWGEKLERGNEKTSINMKKGRKRAHKRQLEEKR
jgi:hypothetical protein